jgi:hypothetical protein
MIVTRSKSSYHIKKSNASGNKPPWGTLLLTIASTFNTANINKASEARVWVIKLGKAGDQNE